MNNYVKNIGILENKCFKKKGDMRIYMFLPTKALYEI